MSSIDVLNTVAINANCDSLQDVFDIEECIEQIVEGLLFSDQVPNDVWLALTVLRERLDVVRQRLLVVPCCLDTVAAIPDKVSPTP